MDVATKRVVNHVNPGVYAWFVNVIVEVLIS